MKLTYETVNAIACGQNYITEEDGSFIFHRFNPDEEKYYYETNEAFYRKALCPSNVRLAFKTDATEIFLSVTTKPGPTRTYFSIDVRVDGIDVGYIDNVEGADLTGAYTGVKLENGDFSGIIELGDNKDKLVEVILPWSVQCTLHEISLKNATYITPSKREKLLIAYGDSITQGYDAIRPSNSYASILGEILSADVCNKAIGGEIIAPELARRAQDASPDYVTVAYGTNDWGKVTSEQFLSNAREFYTALSEKYPSSHIFAVTPIWRADHDSVRPFGPFRLVAELIGKAVESLPNVTLIDAFDFVPQDKSLYADLRLHPNDNGFLPYAELLGAAILRTVNP